MGNTDLSARLQQNHIHVYEIYMNLAEEPTIWVHRPKGIVKGVVDIPPTMFIFPAICAYRIIYILHLYILKSSVHKRNIDPVQSSIHNKYAFNGRKPYLLIIYHHHSYSPP